MPNALVAKLEHFTKLSLDDKLALQNAAAPSTRRLDAREDIILEGDRPEHVNLILSGWACRYKQLEDGRRQIMAYFVPGDLRDLKIFILRSMDHSIATLSPVTLAQIPRETILELTDRHSRLSRALWWSSLVSEAIDRQWIVNLGQRSGIERVGHLICELFFRLRSVGLTDGNSYEFPVTQAELGETLGFSSVHVNRILQELRSRNLITLRGKRLTILDLEQLQLATFFNANYLHLDREGREFDADET